MTAESPPASGQVVQQAREILELIASDGLKPVLVLDDTDKWLNTSWQDDAERVRGAFFGRVVRIIAEDLAATCQQFLRPRRSDGSSPGVQLSA